MDLVRDAAARVRGILDNARTEASRLAGRELGYVESYLPVRFTDDLRRLLDLKRAQRGGTRLAKGSVEKQRKVFVAGGTFLGETLEGANPQQVLDHAERIAKEKLGDDALELFEKNPVKLVDRAISSYQRFAEDNGLARRLGTTMDEVRGLSAGALGPRLDNARRLEDIAQEASTSSFSDELLLRTEAESLWQSAELAAEQGADVPAAIAALEASARAEMATTPALTDDAMRAVLEDGRRVTDTAVAALKILSGGDQQWVAEALNNLQRANAFTDSGWLVKAFDRVTSVWKSLAILSPGFHARNYMGGLFNNALAGVDLQSYTVFARQYAKLRKATQSGTPIAAALEAVDEEYRDAFAAMVRVGLFGSTSGRDFADAAGRPRNRVTAANRKAATAVENNLRGTLFLDRMMKGASVEDALDAVGKYHFFYDETSPFFRQYVKRAVPFATWSRFNFPLQLEGMARKPGLYTRFHHLAHNVELGQENGDEPPSWMRSLMAIRSPFLAPGGRQLFLTPDLPFRDLGETFDLNKNLSSLNPLIKVPLEASRGKKFFNDTPLRGEDHAPTTWTPIVAALYALGPLNGKLGLPKVRREEGAFVLNANDANKLESLMPLLGRLRRLAPSDEKSQAKAFSSWLSFAFGISTQTIYDHQAEMADATRSMKSGKAAGTSPNATRGHVPATRPKPVGIRPSGSGAPSNAIIAGTYNAKRYGS